MFLGSFFDGCLPGAFTSQEGNEMKMRVYYEDTDAAGVVYYANYLRYFERGRTEYLRERGISVGDLARRGFIFPVVRLEIDYRAPALHDDLLSVETAVLEIKKTSFALSQRVLRAGDGKLLVAGKVVLACVDREMKLQRLPEELVQVLKE